MIRVKYFLLVFILLTLQACAASKEKVPGSTDAVPPPPSSLQQPAPISSPRPEGPDRDFKAALVALKAGNAEATLLACRRIVEQYPNTPWYKRSLFLTERAYILLDRPSEAASAMHRVQAGYPELGDYALMLLADYQYSKAGYTEAAALYGQMVQRYPASFLAPRALFMHAQALIDSFSYLQAAEAFRTFLQDNPRSEFAPAAGLGIGRALTAEANLSQAVRAYQDVWVRYPGDPYDQEVEKALAVLKGGGVDLPEISSAELYERGRNLFRSSQHDKAVVTFMAFLDREPNSPNRPEALVLTGTALFNMGRRSEAAALLERMTTAYPADPRTPEALYWTGKSCSKLGEWDRSMKAFQKLLAAYPDCEWADDALFLSGNIYRETSDMKKALSSYARLVREYPESKFADSAIWWSAWASYTAGEYAKAEQILQELVNGYPRSFLVNQARYWQGRAAEKRNNATLAATYYERVLKKGPYTYYGYRAAERMSRLGSLVTDAKAGEGAELTMVCAESSCPDDPLHTFDFDDGAPQWTEETRRMLSEERSFKKTLELMHLDMKKEAAAELWSLQDRLPKRRGALIGLSKAFFELGDYNRSLLLALRNYERYLEGPNKDVAEDLWLLAYPQGFWESIITYSRKYGQDPYFIAAIIREESQFLPEAVSPAGARGLMQVMPATGEWAAQLIKLQGFDRTKLFDSDTGINIGTWFISHLMQRFKNDPVFVSAAYNAGPEAVQGWITKNGYHGERDLFVEQIPFSETRGYVKKVMRNYAEYKRIYGRTTGSADAGPRIMD